jgi:hypothetical protein
VNATTNAIWKATTRRRRARRERRRRCTRGL